MKKTKLFIINTIITLASSLIIKIISSSFDIYLANKIGAEAIGLYSLLMSVYMFAITLATSGIHLATTKIISEELEKGNEGGVSKIVKKCTIYSAIMGIISSILLILFKDIICLKWLGNRISYNIIYILALSLPFVSISSAITGYFMAKRQIAKTSTIQILGQTLRIIIVSFLLTYILPSGINYAALSLVLGGTITELFSFILILIIYLKSKKNKYIAKIKDKDITKRIFKITFPIAITSVIRSGIHTLKHILIPLRLKLSGMSYSKALANYGIITGMAFPVIMFPSVIVFSYSSLLVPEFSRYTVSNNVENMQKDICKLFKITLYFCICIAGIFICYGNFLGNIIFNNPQVGWYIQIMSPLIVLMYLDNVVDNILKGLGKQVSVMCCNIFDLLVSVFFIYFLLPKLGSIGYIIVLYISEILNYVISVLTLFKVTDVKFNYLDWFIIPMLVIAFSILIFYWMNIPTILKLLLTCILYSLILSLKYIFKRTKSL